MERDVSDGDGDNGDVVDDRAFDDDDDGGSAHDHRGPLPEFSETAEVPAVPLRYADIHRQNVAARVSAMLPAVVVALLLLSLLLLLLLLLSLLLLLLSLLLLPAVTCCVRVRVRALQDSMMGEPERRSGVEAFRTHLYNAMVKIKMQGEMIDEQDNMLSQAQQAIREAHTQLVERVRERVAVAVAVAQERACVAHVCLCD